MNIGSGEARELKAIEDVRRGWGWFEDQIGDLPARFLTANDPETFRKKLPAGRLPSKAQKTVKSEGRAIATFNSYLGTLKVGGILFGFQERQC